MKVLYKDKHLLVAKKPAGMLSEDGDGENVLSVLKAENGLDYVGLVHRLDRATEGLMVFSKKKELTGKLSAMMAEGGVTKEYLAVVHGKPQEKSGTFRDLLFRDASANKSYVTDRMRGGVKEAVLDYELLGSADSEDGVLSLVRVRLHTGRTHQIRAQFSHRGMPVFGDGKYGSHANRGRMALASAHIRFVHPVTKKPIDVRELPEPGYPWDLFGDVLSKAVFDGEIRIQTPEGE